MSNNSITVASLMGDSTTITRQDLYNQLDGAHVPRKAVYGTTYMAHHGQKLSTSKQAKIASISLLAGLILTGLATFLACYLGGTDLSLSFVIGFTPVASPIVLASGFVGISFCGWKPSLQDELTIGNVKAELVAAKRRLQKHMEKQQGTDSNLEVLMNRIKPDDQPQVGVIN